MTSAPEFSWLESGDGPPVVFLHGIGGGAGSWAPQLETLAERYRVIALDLPGYEQYEPLGNLSFPALANALTRFLDHLSLEKVHLVGHSIGGMIAQEFAAGQSGRLCSLTLSATSPAFGNPDGDFQKKFIAARLGPIEAGKTMADIAETVVPELVGAKASPEAIQLAKSCMSKVPPATYSAMMHCLITFDRKADLANIAVPTMVLAGEDDTQAPAPMMERMATRIPGARFVCIPGAGHLANIEQPSVFDSALTTFFDSH